MQTSSVKRVCLRKTTMSASSVALNTVETGLGPLRASDVVGRLRHLAMVLRLSPSRAARALFVSELSCISRRSAALVRAEG
jgi:hypothetical protein